MQKRTDIANLVGQLGEHSPAGFAVALHIAYATPTFLFQSYPPEWTEEYSARGLHMQDPTVAWGFSNTGAVRWSALRAQDTAGVFERARAFGLNYGVTIAVLTELRTVASFARSDREFSDDEIARLLEILRSLHDRTGSRRELSSTDREALRGMSIRLTHA
jgi:LuxR family transcriptional regulator